jgi:hypothetical protein
VLFETPYQTPFYFYYAKSPTSSLLTEKKEKGLGDNWFNFYPITKKILHRTGNIAPTKHLFKAAPNKEGQDTVEEDMIHRFMTLTQEAEVAPFPAPFRKHNICLDFHIIQLPQNTLI